MMYRQIIITLPVILLWIGNTTVYACSVLYYKDTVTGNIYVVNNEDYWYDVAAYIQIVPQSKHQYARLWYGWDNFAQGGVNEEGLFFDGATVPEQDIPDGYNAPKGNLGDEILASCSTVEEAVAFLEQEKVALKSGHVMFGDKYGNAVVAEWTEGQRRLTWISGNKLLMTNFLLTDTTKGNYPCYRYGSIENRIAAMEQDSAAITLLKVGNTFGQAAQIPVAVEKSRVGGTLYTSFINITNLEFVLVFKLDNSKITKLDLQAEFIHGRKRKIRLE